MRKGNKTPDHLVLLLFLRLDMCFNKPQRFIEPARNAGEKVGAAFVVKFIGLIDGFAKGEKLTAEDAEGRRGE